jgi:hypothetical protein
MSSLFLTQKYTTFSTSSGIHFNIDMIGETHVLVAKNTFFFFVFCNTKLHIQPKNFNVLLIFSFFMNFAHLQSDNNLIVNLKLSSLKSVIE